MIFTEITELNSHTVTEDCKLLDRNSLPAHAHGTNVFCTISIQKHAMGMRYNVAGNFLVKQPAIPCSNRKSCHNYLDIISACAYNVYQALLLGTRLHSSLDYHCYTLFSPYAVNGVRGIQHNLFLRNADVAASRVN